MRDFRLCASRFRSIYVSMVAEPTFRGGMEGRRREEGAEEGGIQQNLHSITLLLSQGSLKRREERTLKKRKRTVMTETPK